MVDYLFVVSQVYTGIGIYKNALNCLYKKVKIKCHIISSSSYKLTNIAVGARHFWIQQLLLDLKFSHKDLVTI